jgi:diguanylate cyclase (GGDEF)-like protein
LTIGFLSPLVHGYYFGSLLAGVVDAAAERGGRVIAIQSIDAGLHIGSFPEKGFTPEVAWRHIDAFVVVQLAVSDGYLRELSRAGKPIVTICREIVDFACPTVVPDNRGGIAAVIDHLVGHGHRRIAYAGRRPADADDDAREAAYRAELLVRGLEPYEPAIVPWLEPGPDTNGAVAWALLGGEVRPTAVVASTDTTAITVIDALSEAGVAVPREMAVVGFDDINDAVSHRPPLTTVGQSFVQTGFKASSLAFDALDGRPAAPGYHDTPVSLIIRESCGCPATGTERGIGSPEPESAREGFVRELAEALGGDRELRRSGHAPVAAVGDRLLDLFAEVAGGPDADVTGRVAVAGANLYKLIGGAPTMLLVTELLRRYAHAAAARLDPPDALAAGRLDRLACDLSMTLIHGHLHHRSKEYSGFDGHRRHYQISTELVRRDNPDSRSLAWLADTEEVRAGCLALWDGVSGGRVPGDDLPGAHLPGDDASGHPALPGDPASTRPSGDQTAALSVVGTYADGTASPATGGRCAVRDFPPAEFVELLDDRPGELLYLLSVRFDGGDWGFLALIGAFDVREQATFEMFNHWAVLLAVSLDQQRVEDQLRREALFDVLTGLPNRTLYMDRLNQAIELSRRRSGYWFAVVFLDLNGFKLINDSLGHHVGDEVLRRVAERLTGGMRANDTVSRFGGDEFVLLLNDVSDPVDLPATVSRILTLLSAPLEVHDRTLVIRSAAGIVMNVAGQRSADDYIRDADIAMYRAKEIGNDLGQVFDDSMHVGALERLQLESDLRRAVADNEFELYYQPIFRLTDRLLDGVEALIRWHHPTRGLVPPDEFLPVAETTGLIRQIGRWTVRQACQQVRAWRDAFPDYEDFAVSVNLSNHQFWDSDLQSYLWQALTDFDVPPTALVFEVTEGVIMHNQAAAVDVMRRLHADSIKLHVDDFGTGHSSLATVHSFPVDALKIDRSFVARMKEDPRSREFVRIMIEMGSSLGIEVIAEGIETDEEAAMLATMGCPLAQGYLFSRPIPAGGLPEFFRPRSAETAAAGVAGSAPPGLAATAAGADADPVSAGPAR